MRDFKIFAALADLHIGNHRISASSMKKQIKDHCLKPLKDMKYLDGIFICGDILHTIVSLNSDYSELYLWFIDQIYKIAKKRHSTVIIIKGTPAHDNDQLTNIHSYMDNDDGVDFRIYETVEEITIWGDYKVLVLPDIKVAHKKEIEKHLTKDKKYDLILGHGLISTMKFFVQESENMPTKTYEYEPDDLIDSSKGPVLFGHIHQYQTIRNHFYYIGPFTLLERGGINSGFVIGGIYDKDRSKFKIEHYINPDAANYYDFHITRKILADYPIDEIFEAIDDLLKPTKENDLVTLRITRGDDIESADKVYMLESRYRKDPRISIVKKVKSTKEEEHEKENMERQEKYSYIMDTNLSMSEILFKYYETEVKPTLSDQYSAAAKITEDDFRRILKEFKEDTK